MERTDMRTLIAENRSDLAIKSEAIKGIYFSRSIYSSMFYLLDEDKKYAREEYWRRTEKDTVVMRRASIIKDKVGYEGECITFDWE